MYRTTITKTPLLALGVASASALLACAPAGGPEGLAQGRSQGVSSPDRLTSQEWSTYVANQQYLVDLVPRDVAVRLNYADPRQYEFVVARLKLAGKTAENSPYLMQLLEAHRQKQIASGLRAGRLAALVTETADLSSMHYFEGASLGSTQVGVLAADTLARSQAASTDVGGVPYVYLDTAVYTSTGRPIAPLKFKEEFIGDGGDELPGANVGVDSSGDTAVSNIRRYRYDTLKIIESDDGEFLDSFRRTEVGAVNPQLLGPTPQLAAPNIGAPVDVIIDGRISLCMDRAWTNDCDEILHGAAQSIQVPLQGSIAAISSHVFDPIAVETIRSSLVRGQDHPDKGSIKLVLTNVGGGCDVTNGDTLFADMSSFWNHVQLSENNRVFSWDLTGENAAYFDDGCRQVQDFAKLTALISLPMRAVPSGEQWMMKMTITNDPQVPRPEARILPITLTNSCLAAGTQIQLGDGKLAAVESLRIGQEVFNPYATAGHSLTITDTAVGSERAPMVRIHDEAGRTLLMTEMHPIATADRGMVQARLLRAGDVVMTQQGPSKLVTVTREPYSGQVYNLKVGSESELADLGVDQTIVYANGFVVGDGQIQSKYESLAQKYTGASAEVPERWRRDQLSSSHRK